MDRKSECEFCPPASADVCSTCFHPALSLSAIINGFVPQHQCTPHRVIAAGIGAVCLYLAWRLIVSLNLHYPAATGLLFVADIMTGRCPVGFLLVLWNLTPVEPACAAPSDHRIGVWNTVYDKELSTVRLIAAAFHQIAAHPEGYGRDQQALISKDVKANLGMRPSIERR